MSNNYFEQKTKLKGIIAEVEKHKGTEEKVELTAGAAAQWDKCSLSLPLNTQIQLDFKLKKFPVKNLHFATSVSGQTPRQVAYIWQTYI